MERIGGRISRQIATNLATLLKIATPAKKQRAELPPLRLVAEPTGLEPATSDVTGRRSNQLNYDSAKIKGLGRHGGIRTPNLFLVREAVYH